MIHNLLSRLGYGALSPVRNLMLVTFLSGPILSGSALAEPVTIAALGDSLTQGYGLPVEEGLVPQLQQWLTAHGADVVMINAGVSGDTTAGGLSRIDWTLTPDVDAVIVALGGNDFLRGIDPAVSRENLRGILQVATDKGVKVLLIGLAVSTNYGPEYKRDFEAMYVDLAAEFGVPMIPNLLQAIDDAPGSPLDYAQADGLHPNATGVALIVEAIGPQVLALAQ